MTAGRVLSWAFGLEGLVVCAVGGLLLLVGLGTGVGVSAGWIDLTLGSDVPKGAIFMVIGGSVLALGGVPLLFAARNMRRNADGRPSAAVAVAVTYHVLLLGLLVLSLR